MIKVDEGRDEGRTKKCFFNPPLARCLVLAVAYRDDGHGRRRCVVDGDRLLANRGNLLMLDVVAGDVVLAAMVMRQNRLLLPVSVCRRVTSHRARGCTLLDAFLHRA